MNLRFLFRLGLAIKITLDSVGFGFRRAQNQSPNPTAQTRKNLLLLSNLTHQPTKPERCLKFWIGTVGYRRVVALCPPLSSLLMFGKDHYQIKNKKAVINEYFLLCSFFSFLMHHSFVSLKIESNSLSP